MDPLIRPSTSVNTGRVVAESEKSSLERRTSQVAQRSMWSSALYAVLTPFRFIGRVISSGFDALARLLFSGLPKATDPVSNRNARAVIVSDDGTTADLVEERLDHEWETRIAPELAKPNSQANIEVMLSSFRFKCDERLNALPRNEKFNPNREKLEKLKDKVTTTLESHLQTAQTKVSSSTTADQLIHNLSRCRTFETLLGPQRQGLFSGQLNTNLAPAPEHVLIELSNTAIDSQQPPEARKQALDNLVSIWTSYPAERFSSCYATTVKQIRNDPNSRDFLPALEQHRSNLDPKTQQPLIVLTLPLDTEDKRIKAATEILQTAVQAFEVQDISKGMQSLNLFAQLDQSYGSCPEFRTTYENVVTALTQTPLPSDPQKLEAFVVQFEDHMTRVKGTDLEKTARILRQKILEAPLEESLKQPIKTVDDIEKRFNFLKAAHEFHRTSLKERDSVYNPQAWVETVASRPSKDIQALISSNTDKATNPDTPLQERVEALHELSRLANFLYEHPSTAIHEEMQRLTSIIDDFSIPTDSDSYRQAEEALSALKATVQEAPTLDSILTTLKSVSSQLKEETTALIATHPTTAQLLDHLHKIDALARSAVVMGATHVTAPFRASLGLLVSDIKHTVASKLSDGSDPLSTQHLQDLYTIQRQKSLERPEGYSIMDDKERAAVDATLALSDFDPAQLLYTDTEDTGGVLAQQATLNEQLLQLTEVRAALASESPENRIRLLDREIESLATQMTRLSETVDHLQEGLELRRQERDELSSGISLLSAQMVGSKVNPIQERLDTLTLSVEQLKGTVQQQLQERLTRVSQSVGDLSIIVDTFTTKVRTSSKKEAPAFQEELTKSKKLLEAAQKEIKVINLAIEDLARAPSDESFFSLLEDKKLPDAGLSAQFTTMYAEMASQQKTLKEQLRQFTSKSGVSQLSEEGVQPLEAARLEKQQQIADIEATLPHVTEEFEGLGRQIASLQEQRTSLKEHLQSSKSQEKELEAQLASQWVRTVRARVLEKFPVLLGSDPEDLQAPSVRDAVKIEIVTTLVDRAKKHLGGYESRLGKEVFDQGISTVDRELHQSLGLSGSNWVDTGAA